METPKTDQELKRPNIPFTERLKSIPEVFGIRVNEEPHYKVLKKEGDYEIRHYPAQVVAKITIRGFSFNDFREIGFNNLASYIFGENLDEKDMPMTAPVLEKKEIAMTAPILQQQDQFGSWTMSFILPHEYTIQNAPRPKDPRIVLEEVPAYDAASISYSGNNTFEKIEFQKKELKKWLEKHPEYHAAGDFFIADYSAPFVIPFMKKNEVQVRIDSKH